MRRFFFNNNQEHSEDITITGQEARHIATVLRLEPGTQIELFDGQGSIVTAAITAARPDKVTVQVLQRHQARKNPFPLTLIQAMLKGKKMDLLIQKATELGVDTFQPLISTYCEKRKYSASQQQRWQRIMLEACKQCGRPFPMLIAPPLALDELTIPAKNSNCILPWEDEHTIPLTPSLLKAHRPTFLLIGPEGGLQPVETTHARSIGFTTVSLGQRILRAETAALATVSIVQFLAGNLAPRP